MSQVKQYLNKDERDNFLGFSGLGIYLQKRLDKWSANLTSDERRRFKTALTNIEKAQASIINRLPHHEVLKIVKASKEHDVRILTIEGATALEKRSKQEYEKNLHIKIEEMEIIATQLLIHNCYKCKTACDKCIYYGMLSRFLIPGLNSENNCPYAYHEKSNFSKTEHPDDILIFKEALKHHEIPTKKASKKSRKAKKTENRFDEDDEVTYVYNFTPKGVR